MMKLYWCPRTRSFSALWLMEETGAPYERVLTDITTGAQRAPEYLAINPMGKVPAITDNQRGLLLFNEYPFPVSVEWLLRHLLHDLQHHVLDIRRGAARIALTDLPEVYTVRREKPL